MIELVRQLKTHTKFRYHRFHKFKPQKKFKIDLGGYTIKTADTGHELLAAFKLRHEVFNNEFRGIPGSGLDYDVFDHHFDHLIILDRNKNKIIGTYRLRSSDKATSGYTDTEFDLSPMTKLSGPFMELGRACIHKDYRKGSVITLLWKGIHEYMTLTEANILFGCSSLKINNPREAALVFTYLKESQQVSEEVNCIPRKAYKMADIDTWIEYFAKGLTEAQKEEAQNLIPSLLGSYLKLGCKLGAEPAFDKDFDCIDLLTVLDKAVLGENILKKFGRRGVETTP